MLYAMLAAVATQILVLAVPYADEARRLARLFQAQEEWAEMMDRPAVRNPVGNAPTRARGAALATGDDRVCGAWITRGDKGRHRGDGQGRAEPETPRPGWIGPCGAPGGEHKASVHRIELPLHGVGREPPGKGWGGEMVGCHTLEGEPGGESRRVAVPVGRGEPSPAKTTRLCPQC